ncbi:DUF6056 family protein [Streptomyces lavendulae]|uniref:DUF6056 family protein n=1 Tax=Streptomyces lavendulae TaxID=1914 RepID=UPI0038082D98
MGIYGIVYNFYSTENGRISNAFLSGVIYSGGLSGPKWLPMVLILTLGAGMLLFVRTGLRMLGCNAPPVALVAVVATLEVLVFYAGTRSYQVLLWAPSTITHTLPSVIGMWAVLLGTWAGGRSRGFRLLGISSALLIGFFIGTLSEPFALVSGLFIGVSALLFLPALKFSRGAYLSTWAGAWCLGIICGLTVLYASPGARWRRSQQPPTGSVFSIGEIKSLIYDWLQIWHTIFSQWGYLAAFAAGVFVGVLSHSDPSRLQVRREIRVPRSVLLLLPALLVALSSLAVAFGLRTGYGSTGWTYARAWTNFVIPWLLALCLYGALTGRWIAGRVSDQKLRNAFSVPVGVIILACVVSLVPAVETLATRTVLRAVKWDAQDARIRSERSRGILDVEYEPLNIGALAEPYFTRVYENDWVSQCVSRYYRVERIHRS